MPGGMSDREQPGHEPAETHDKEFAPVTRGGDARGRTVPGERGGEDVSGTGVPGVDSGRADAFPPDEEGVREAERHDDTRDSG